MYYVAAAAHGKLQAGEVSCQMHVVRTQMTRLRSVQLYRIGRVPFIYSVQKRFIYERTADRRDRRRPRTRCAPHAHSVRGFAPRPHSAHVTECGRRENPMQQAR